MYRIGIGYDVHKFAQGRKLILGGVEIPFELGLEGHSDADVLTHSICDAILGAIGEPDIGTKFPDSSPEYKGMSSLILFKETLTLCKSKGFEIANLDTVLVCEKPKIVKYISKIKERLASIAEISKDRVGIKATTSEGLGFTGRVEGIASHAVVLVTKI